MNAPPTIAEQIAGHQLPQLPPRKFVPCTRADIVTLLKRVGRAMRRARRRAERRRIPGVE